MRRTAADRAYVVLVRVNYLRARFTTLSRRQHGYARIWFCCAALSRLQTLLLLSERNLNKVDRVEPARLRPSNDFSERTVGSLEGEHFKPGARKGRGVVHLIGWAASWNTILSPKLTMSTFGFAGFTRCSGAAFSYDPI